MLLVEIASLSEGVVLSRRPSGTLFTQAAGEVDITDEDGNPVIVYSDEDFNGPASPPLTPRPDGTLPKFIRHGRSYKFTEPDGDERLVDVPLKAAVSGLHLGGPTRLDAGSLVTDVASEWGIDSTG